MKLFKERYERQVECNLYVYRNYFKINFYTLIVACSNS